MNANLEWENGLRWLAIHSWQAGMLVLLVLAVQLVLRRRLTNRWRFALWWIVLARLLLPINPASTVSLFNFLSPRVQMENPMVARATPPPREVSVKSADSNPVSSVMPPAPAVAGEAASSPDLSARQRTILPVRPSSKSVAPVTYENYLMPGLAGMWVAGVLLLTGVIAFQVLHFGRKLARTASSSDPRLQRLLDDCRREFGLARPVELRETGAVESPVLFGLRRPQLLLPRGIGDQFSDRELRYIFLHELAHVKRGDLWLNWVVAALQTVHWFNPLLWVGFARLRADRELACDELALLYAGDRAGTAYGETVVKLLEHLNRPMAIPGLVGILEDKNQMRRRIQMIASFRKPGRWSLLAVILVVALAIVALTDARNKSPVNDRSPTARPVVTEGRAVRITVLDAATGLPLEGAEVLAPHETAFFDSQPVENSPHWLTDKSGGAVIRLGKPAPKSIWQKTWFALSARKEGFAPQGMSWSDGSKDVRSVVPKQITMRLNRGTSVGGVVVDEAGVPQAGIRVRVFGCGYRFSEARELMQQYPEFWNESVGGSLPVTDAQGRWEQTGFPTNLDEVAVRFIRPDGSVVKFRNPEKVLNPNEPEGAPMDFPALLAGQARFVLKAGYELNGLAVDRAGRPLAGVQVKTGYGLVIEEKGKPVVSDAAGRFVVRHINHPQIILTGEADDYAITSLIVDVHSNLPEVRLSMDELAPLQIHVEDSKGRAVPGAKITAGVYRTEGQLLDFTGGTDHQGDLVWKNAPLSSFALAAEVADPPMRQKIVLRPRQREATFHLRKGLDEGIAIDGTVVDAKTGAPVKLESVEYQTLDQDGFNGGARLGESGFHLDLPAKGFRSGMYPSYQLKLTAPKYATLIVPWRDFDEGDWKADFKMQPQEDLSGTVSMPDGRPASVAQIWIRPDQNSGDLVLTSPTTTWGDRWIFVKAGDDGKFNLPEVPGNPTVIFTHLNGFLTTTIDDVKHTPQVRLLPWGEVRGRLKIKGRPQGETRVELAPLQPSRPRGEISVAYSATTDRDGNFTFTRVPTGEYKLYRSQPRINWEETEDHPLPVVVQAGETTTVDYSNAGRVIVGRLVADPAGMSVNWTNNDDILVLKHPWTEVPRLFAPVRTEDYATSKAFQQAGQDFYSDPTLLAHLREARTYLLAVQPDGAFWAEDIPAGTYELRVRVTKPHSDPNAVVFDDPQNDLGSLTREVVVPAGDTPYDLGALSVHMKD